MAQKPYLFRAVHTENSWRKAAHETFERATSIGNRSALALFEHRNDVINYSEEGEPLYVIVWHKDEGDGTIFKPDPSDSAGMRRSSVVPRSTIDVWEKQKGASEKELEQYFGRSRTPSLDSGPVEPTYEDIDVEELKTTEQVNDHLSNSLAESELLSPEARMLRINKASRSPQRVEVSTYAFIRNPDVIVEVLLRANGQCEHCQSSAPFNRAKDGSPYLEVHHITQLSKGGEDTISNAQALCPNCHRYQHYGL